MTTPRALPPEFTIYSLAGLRQEWLAWLPEASSARRADGAAPEPWPVDASAVSDVDAAGLQMLVALAHSVAACGKALVLTAPSAAIASACEGLGLGHLMDGATPGARA
jgi:phospholipid transport system transporter-binding protein